MLVLSLLLGLAAAIPTPEPDALIKIALPSRRLLTRATGDADAAVILTSLNNTLKKYHATPLHYFPGLTGAALSKRQSEEALVDQVEAGEDELYYGSSTIGVAKQVFTLDFDTGSSDLFVPGPQCGTAQGCPYATKYDQEGTNTMNTTSVTYGSGMVSGNNYIDTVTVAGVTIPQQGLISLTQASGFSTSNADGLCGLAFPSIAQSGFTPFSINVFDLPTIPAKEFSFYLGRAASGTQSNSELTLGGRDTSKFTGAVTLVPVTTQGYWQVALQSVTVNGISAGLTTAGQAAIDTGTTVVIAPTAAAAAIFALIPLSFAIPLVSGSPTETLFAYPCNTASQFIPSITFAGHSFGINPLDFNLGVLTPTFAEQIGNSTLATLLDTLVPQYCVAAIIAADLQPTENLYVVGDTFIKSWYSIFNYNNAPGGGPSVSFAKAVGS